MLAKTIQANETFRGKREFRRINPGNDEATYKTDLAFFIEELMETGTGT